MHAWAKFVFVALLGGLILSIAAAPATASSPQASEAPESVAVQAIPDPTSTTAYTMATQALGRLSAKPTRIDATRRIKAIPSRIGAAIASRTVTDRNHDGRDDDGLILFTLRQRNRACLDLNARTVRPGDCNGNRPVSPVTGKLAAVILHRSLVWFDQHDGIYGQTAQDASLVEEVATTELPEAVHLTFDDADADGLVDEGAVLIADVVTGTCLHLSLPQHDPEGESYDSFSYEVPCP